MNENKPVSARSIAVFFSQGEGFSYFELLVILRRTVLAPIFLRWRFSLERLGAVFKIRRDYRS